MRGGWSNLDTTKLIVEYLIVGILVSIAIIFLGVSILAPADLELFPALFSPDPLSSNTVISALIFLPIAYGVGVIAEYVAMRLFETKADAIKLQRLNYYLNKHESILKKSPLLKSYIKRSDKEARITEMKIANMLFGEMRFYAMTKSPFLQGEIEAHLNRLRILRALPISELLFLTGYIVQVLRSGISNVSIFALVFLGVVLPINISAITNRQERYCRAIERAYTALIVDEKVR